MMFKEYLSQYRNVITDNNLNNGICFDGAVNPDRYFAKTPRLLLLLKETNGNNNDGTAATELTDWDYMEWVRAQASKTVPLYRSVYRNLAMWAKQFDSYALGKKLVAGDLIDSDGLIVNSELCDALSGIAIVNLKKSWGTEQTDWGEMNRYLEADSNRKEILLHQMDTLKPNLVLCGGTFAFAHQIFGADTPIQTCVCDDGQRIDHFCTDGILFTSCYHPSKPGWSRKKSFAHANNIYDLFFSMR